MGHFASEFIAHCLARSAPRSDSRGGGCQPDQGKDHHDDSLFIGNKNADSQRSGPDMFNTTLIPRGVKVPVMGPFFCSLSDSHGVNDGYDSDATPWSPLQGRSYARPGIRAGS